MPEPLVVCPNLYAQTEEDSTKRMSVRSGLATLRAGGRTGPLACGGEIEVEKQCVAVVCARECRPSIAA